MKNCYWLLSLIMFCSDAMQPSDNVLLEQFKNMKTRDLEDPAMEELFKIAMKYSIIRGHQLWKMYVHQSPLSQSIPGSIVANARRVLVALIRDQKLSLRENIDTLKAAIDEEYRIKMESNEFPIILPKGRFTDGSIAPINVIYNYYGLKHFEISKKFCLCYVEEREQDCAFTFFDKGVRPLLRTPTGDETVEYQMLKTLFIKERKRSK